MKDELTYTIKKNVIENTIWQVIMILVRSVTISAMHDKTGQVMPTKCQWPMIPIKYDHVAGQFR